MRLTISLSILFSVCTIVSSFSIPGVSTSSFAKGADIPIFANELDSTVTQIPYDYYYLNFCKPKGDDFSAHMEENIGSSLLGDRHDLTPFRVHMQINTTCRTLCKQTLSEVDVSTFKWMIGRDYTMNFIADNLPALYVTSEPESVKVGIPVGYFRDNNFYIHNHLSLEFEYHTPAQSNTSRIVGFRVVPMSLGMKKEGDKSGPQCRVGETLVYENTYPQPFDTIGTNGIEVFFTYDVVFRESNKTIGTRWDSYKLLGGDQIHWLSILNSFVINIILTCIIAHILRRTLRNDIRRYEELARSEDLTEDSGWKQLSRDVFRAPDRSIFLAVFVGSGVQIGAMIVVTLLFACLGFTQQADRGSLLTIVILLFNFMGVFAGYYSARIYKMFNGAYWIRCTVLTCLLYPGINFIVFYVIDMLMTFEKSSAAVDSRTIFTLCSLWFGISSPLVFFGSLIGFKKQAIENPAKCQSIASIIPPQPWYLSTFFSCMLGGLLPFGAVFMELVFIMMSVWKHSFYYLFAFLFLVIIILIVTSAEISIVISYLQLCHGNHRIWWRSFLTTGSSAFYVFAYAVYYYFTQLHIQRFSSTVLYFGYMGLISFTFFIFCGSIGFFASFIFVRKIYTLIKLD